MRQLHLNVNVIATGKHEASWRLHDDPSAFVDVEHYRAVAAIAERGTFDAVFLSDAPVLDPAADRRPWNALDPLVLLAGVAAATERIGLIATASTTFNEPYELARRFATLDHVSGGRSGWNIVTTQSPEVASNFGGGEMPSKAERYARAEEFVEVAIGLWDGWDDDTIVADRTTGVFADTSRIRQLDHIGPHFSVRGPLGVPRGPQGRPVLVQAGASEGGRRLAARFADVVFSAQHSLEGAQRFYAETKASASAWGRDPDKVHILPGLLPIVGGTEREAWERKAELDADLDFDRELGKLAARLGVPAEALDLDRELPEAVLAEASASSTGFQESLTRLARTQRLTVRGLLARNSSGHRLVVGAPEQIADEIEAWFNQGAADGFNLNSDALPSGLEAFVDHVVPELRRRGIFRHEYSGKTLRHHLGLDRPWGAHGTPDPVEKTALP